MTAVEIYANQPSTTVVSGGADAPSSGTVETWTVASSATFPAASSTASPPTQFHIGDTAFGYTSEIIAVTNVSGTTWTVTRGAENTIPVAHIAGFAITTVVTAGALGALAPLASPALTGTPTAPTASPLTDSTQIATTAYTDAAAALKGPLLSQTSVQTSNYGASANQLVPCSTASGSLTVTLPDAPAAGTIMGVKMVILGTGNTVTIAAAGSDVFNKSGGSTSETLSLVNQGLLLQYQSGIWLVVSDDLPLADLDARYVAISAAPWVTVSPIGLTTSGVTVANNGAQFGPDTPGTTTCGIQEALNSLPACTVNQKSSFGGGYTISGQYGRLSLQPGIYETSSLITVPAG